MKGEKIMTATICVECPSCNKVSEVIAPVDGFRRWQAGEFIQDALPELSAEEREILISGICPECWDEMFPEDDE
jgi:hypothetical protein